MVAVKAEMLYRGEMKTKPLFFFSFLMMMMIFPLFLLDSTMFVDGVSAESHGQVSVLSIPGGIAVPPQVTVYGDGDGDGDGEADNDTPTTTSSSSSSQKNNIRTRKAGAANSTRVLQEDQGLVNEGTGVAGVCYTEVPYDPQRHQQVYTVGVLAIRGFESAYNDFNKTFSEYLTLTAGQRFDPPVRFEMKPLNFNTLFSDVEDSLVDFIYVNPSAFSCIESEYEALSLVSQVSRRRVSGNVYDLKKFGGVIFARKNNPIVSIDDLEDKIIAAASISGLGSGQMQFKRMIDAGMNYLQDPRQLVFTSNQGKVVQGVYNGDFDVGFVRTDQLERSKDENGQPYNVSEVFTIINPIDDLQIDGTPFPFQSSTELYAEWNLAALLHVDPEVSREVQRAMLNVGDFAHIGDVLLDCYSGAASDGSPTECDQWTLEDMAVAMEGRDGVPPQIRCDTTRSKAFAAAAARTSGKYAEWVPSLSYMQLRSMQEATGFISLDKDSGTWRCVRSTEIYDAISCPAGTYRKSRQEVDDGCSSQGLECAEGFQCLCRPCVVPVDSTCENAILIGDSCVSLAIFLPCLILPLLLLVGLVAHFYVEYKRKQTDSVWIIKPNELLFDTPPKVIGQGTFGFVLLAEYRGTDVAVKRVIPPMGSDNRKSPFGAGLFIGMDETQDLESQIGTHTIKGIAGALPKPVKKEKHPGTTSLSFRSQVAMIQNITKGATDDAIGLKTLNPLVPSADESRKFDDGSDKTEQEEFVTEKRSSWWRVCCRSDEDEHHRRMKIDFVHEIRQLARLRHPNITTVMGAVMPTRRDEPMLVMEYMRQGSLFDVLHDSSITMRPDQILAILQDIAQGLRFLHSASPQVIHGDLKSANVLVDTNFCAKVADFGLTGKRSAGAVGTPYWMAPELLTGKSVNTAASDIYSFGIVIFEAYTCRTPYEGERYEDVIREVCDPHMKKRPPIPVNCPPKVAKLMSECLFHNPEERPPSDLLDVALKVEMKVKERTNRLEQLNRDLEAANYKIESASKMQLQHFAAMSHEIRTPLNCIIGMSSLLEDTDLDSMQKESIEMIISSGSLLRQIVDDVLDYSKLTSGNAEVLVEQGNLQETLNAVMHLIKTSRVTTEKQLRIRSLYDPVLPEFVEMDSRRIQQILYNLLGNAIKFSNPRGDVELGVHVFDGVLTYSVKDYGRGIDESKFDAIFEPFVQTKNGLTNTEGGTGLGLPITKSLTEALGGQITVQSELGSWTEFTVEFPFYDPVADKKKLSSQLRSTRVYLIADGSDYNTSFIMEVMTYFNVDFEFFPSMREIAKMVASGRTVNESLSSSSDPVKTHICLVQEDLYDKDTFRDFESHAPACLLSFGPKFSVEHSRRHYRSLADMFPSVLMKDFATYSEEVQTDKKPSKMRDPQSSSGHQISSKFSSLRILIAEDNLVNQKVLSKMLKRLGVEHVIIVGNGKEAVEREAEEEFDLVLMDMQMPVMDGIDACQEISRRTGSNGSHPRAKVIFCTAHVSESFRQYAVENGAIAYLPKPCTVENVKDCLTDFCVQFQGAVDPAKMPSSRSTPMQ
eukprot:CAMPEP_0113493838 /NCGR_PEP_ID=MMETSP0014_2-20120614/28800_1 /TAXON_ID=2857 /ORGANISM="Nitzschia sp." /LENGTH=1552 /DNA_ID=CAMNT_0000387717 /DNA_START=353 /DNA_END=5011 /DNA_ORIENTATION=- /assembly_acc=CAM_ASM_000159